MPVLSNPKHELFAQELAKGKTADEAYVLAGYEENRGNATRLKANESVQKRVAELQEQTAETIGVTVDSLIIELEEARGLARTTKQPGAMVQASVGKAKLLGLIVEKKEDVTPRRRVEEIDARIRKFLESGSEAGASGPVGGTRADAERDETFPTVPGHGTA